MHIELTSDKPLTYGSYLRVPELLSLQTPLAESGAHDEMLFIILQQAQELWFKQVLYELEAVIGALEGDQVLEAVRLLDRVNRIFAVLSEEVEVMETLRPPEFQTFRSVLKTASGFESEQFRELELVSGLEDEHFLRLASRLIDIDEVRSRWPVTLRQAFYRLLTPVDADTAAALTEIYGHPEVHPQLMLLAEAMSEYEMRFAEWRFHHMKMVERVIGDLSPGTGGSTGSGYLGRTLNYRFFPELWEARNRLTAQHADRTE